MAGIRPPEPRAYPIFRLGTALATLLFVVSVALNGLAPIAAEHLAAAPAPAFGIGGGGGSGGGGPSETSPAAATEAPILPFAAAQGTPTIEATQQAGTDTSQPPQTQDSTRNLAATSEAYKSAPQQFARPASANNEQPVPFALEFGFGGLAILSAAVTWLLQRRNEQRFRERWTLEVKFCPRCGTAVGMAERFGRQREVCPACGWIHFADPKVAAAILLEENGRVLLVRRVNEPYRGMWTLPAGFVDADEDPARRC